VRVSVVESARLDGWPGPKARDRSVDPALVSSWADGVLYVHPLYDGRIRPGARYVAAHRLLGRTVVLVHQVEEVTPGYGWRTRADRPGAAVTVALRLHPGPDPTVELETDVTVVGAARLARPLLAGSMRRSARRAVRRLASRLEAQASMRQTVR
jgi:hypothetical protein